jgi:hypothetical protein
MRDHIGRRIAAVPPGATGTVVGPTRESGAFPVQWDEPLTGAPDSDMTDEWVAEEGVTWRFVTPHHT